MISKNKTLRFYFWFITEFIKKYLKLILLSFFITLITIIGIISLTPYLKNFLVAKKNVIGVVGSYDFNSMPEEILTKISNGLIFIDQNGKIKPALAESWTVANNGKEYKIKIKKNLLWNNGKPFFPNKNNYKFIDVETKVLDNQTLVFVLKKPLAVFLTYLNKPIIDYPLNGVAGLYKVDRYKLKAGIIKEIYLSPNKKNLPILVYKFFDNETKMINAYKLGDINQMSISKKSTAESFSTWKNTIISKNVDYNHLLTLFLNNNSPLFEEKDVRQAITMSINKQALQSYGQQADSPIPPISWAYNPNLKKLSYSPDDARKIISKIINKKDDKTKLTLLTYYEYLDIGNEITSFLNNVGINTSLNLIAYEQPSNYDIILAYFKVPIDPDQYFFWHSTQAQGNITGYKNLKVDKLLEDGRNTTSIEDRKKIYYEFQKNLIDDCPAVFVYFPYIYTIRRK